MSVPREGSVDSITIPASRIRALGPYGCYLYACIVAMCGESGQAELSLREIADYAGVAVPTIRKEMPGLIEAGIERERPVDTTSPTIYRVSLCNEIAQRARPAETPKKPRGFDPMLDDDERSSDNGSRYPADFKRFYDSYPRKVGKQTAFVAWRKAREKASEKAILQGVTAFVAHHDARKTAQQFLPHPATWLNQEMWADKWDVPEPKRRFAAERADAFADL